MQTFQVENFIGGAFVRKDNFLPSFNPANGKLLANIPDSDKDDVELAVTAAKVAFAGWKSTTPQQRCGYLMKLADLIEQNLEELARLESLDQGKPLTLARAVDIPRAVHNFRHFATAFLHQVNMSNQMPGVGAMNYTLKEPSGIAGIITPWNLPLYLLSFKIAPCLAAGCVCICKPSEMTSLTAWRLCQLCQLADLPPGVVNMVFGTGPKAGEAIVVHPDINLITFTGSTAVGQKIGALSAPFFKKLSLELGGKNAAIVFKDCDLETTTDKCIRSSFINQGEVCLATSRIFVERPIYEEFLSLFVEKAKAFRTGDPLKEDTKMGALISPDHKAKVLHYIQLSRESGGIIHCGPDLPPGFEMGNFVAPTVISNLDDSCLAMQDEIFGPVTVISPFDEFHEAIQRANNVPYGLCASVYTRDLNTAHKAAKNLTVGTVWINCWLLRHLDMPFGGVKKSGIGFEGTYDSIDFFTDKRTVCLQCDN